VTLSDLRAALQISNVSAFLRVIRERESSQDDSAYTVINGGSHFDAPADPTLWRHPWHGIPTTRGARACGAYQFLGTTWANVAEQYGVTDFSPPNQDAMAVALIAGRGALEDVIAGRFEDAVAKCRKEWTSLPGAAESSAGWTMDKARAVFVRYDGGLAGAPAPVDDRTTTQPEAAMGAVALPLLAQLIPQVLGLFSGRAQAVIAEKTGADPKLAADFMQSMIAQVGHAMSVPVVDNATATQAVAALTAAPPEDKAAKAKALEAQALATIDALMKAGDKASQWDQAMWDAQLTGRNAAAERAQRERWDMTPWLVWFAGIGTSICSALMLAAIVYQSIWVQKGIDPVLLGLAGPLLAITYAAWKSIFDYRFDGTKESTAQSQALMSAATKGSK